MPHCVSDVPVAEPATPQPTGYISTQFSATFTTVPTPATLSGVTVSCSPRRVPMSARIIIMGGMPHSEWCR